ncbi:hypothetical protein PI95_032515 [Hassallia byssoidea VB512170]|uniref:Uncharacterized protein n=1 Tax=Hassallia byssoidea VB512170 TaxID=1304833 RepID=A0A846HJW3_9CYAN|nr:hypothetical protein [Hassalia byssoidea VB512170]
MKKLTLLCLGILFSLIICLSINAAIALHSACFVASLSAIAQKCDWMLI